VSVGINASIQDCSERSVLILLNIPTQRCSQRSVLMLLCKIPNQYSLLMLLRQHWAFYFNAFT